MEECFAWEKGLVMIVVCGWDYVCTNILRIRSNAQDHPTRDKHLDLREDTVWF